MTTPPRGGKSPFSRNGPGRASRSTGDLLPTRFFLSSNTSIGDPHSNSKRRRGNGPPIPPPALRLAITASANLSGSSRPRPIVQLSRSLGVIRLMTRNAGSLALSDTEIARQRATSFRTATEPQTCEMEQTSVQPPACRPLLTLPTVHAVRWRKSQVAAERVAVAITTMGQSWGQIVARVPPWRNTSRQAVTM